MADNIHEVVQLLAARLESHPEEFNGPGFPGKRWDKVVAVIIPWLRDEERQVLRGIYMDRAHTLAMGELLSSQKPNISAQNALSDAVVLDAYEQQQQQQQRGLRAYNNSTLNANILNTLSTLYPKE